MPAPQLSLAALATPKGLLIAGVPIVGIVALLSHKGAKPAVVTGAVTNANDTAIGTGQLADFENALLHAIAFQPPAADTGSPSAPTDQPPKTPTPPTQPVAATTPPAVPPASTSTPVPVATATYTPSPLDIAVALGQAPPDQDATVPGGATVVAGPASLGTGAVVDAGARITGERYVALPNGQYQVIL